jgi:hypothetical protein
MGEGTGISRLSTVISKLGRNDFDRFELATVTSIAPTTIKLDNDPLLLDAFDLVIAEHLTTHKRKVIAEGSDVETETTFVSPLTVGDRVIVVETNGGQTYVVLDRAVTL